MISRTIATAVMPARWLRPGDHILLDAVIWHVLRVDVTPEEPTVAVIQQASGELAGRQHQTKTLGADAKVDRVTAMPRATAPAGALL